MEVKYHYRYFEAVIGFTQLQGRKLYKGINIRRVARLESVQHKMVGKAKVNIAGEPLRCYKCNISPLENHCPLSAIFFPLRVDFWATMSNSHLNTYLKSTLVPLNETACKEVPGIYFHMIVVQLKFESTLEKLKSPDRCKVFSQNF